MWNIVTTITQSLFHRAVTHKALLFAPTISGYASNIQHISMPATYKTNIAGCYNCINCVVVQYCERCTVWHFTRYPFQGFALCIFVLPRKVKHYTKACAWNSICSVVLSSKIPFSVYLVKKNLYSIFCGIAALWAASYCPMWEAYALAWGLSTTFFSLFKKTFCS